MNERTPLIPREDHLADPKKLSRTVRNSVLASIWIGVFLGALDTTIVSTLISDISSEFKRSNQASWLGTSYLLSTATFTPLYGRLANIVGRRGAYLIAVSSFTVGTAICALAPSLLVLIAGRFIAGIGGGGLMATSSIIASDLVPLKQRGFYQGLANIFYGVGAGLGGPLGGLVAVYIGWRWAFILQIPVLFFIGFLVFVFVRFKVPTQGKTKEEMIRRIDYGGSAGLVLSLGGLLVSLSFKNNEGLEWGHPLVWGSLVVSIVATLAFIAIEVYIAPEPVLPMIIFKERNGLCFSIANTCLAFTAFSLLYFYPMYFEIVRQQSASMAGAHLLPNSIALSLGSLFAGWYIRRTGKYYYLLIASAALPILSITAISYMTTLDDIPEILQWSLIVPSGFGYASVLTAGLIGLIASFHSDEMAVATGTSYLFRYVGQVVGVAVSSSILQASLSKELTKRITGPDASKIIEQIRKVATSIESLPEHLKLAAIQSYAKSMQLVFGVNVIVAFICFLSLLPVQEHELPSSFQEDTTEQEGQA